MKRSYCTKRGWKNDKYSYIIDIYDIASGKSLGAIHPSKAVLDIAVGEEVYVLCYDNTVEIYSRQDAKYTGVENPAPNDYQPISCINEGLVLLGRNNLSLFSQAETKEVLQGSMFGFGDPEITTLDFAAEATGLLYCL